jgi:hypothetical protein
MAFVKSSAVTDTEVCIERVHLALYDSYVVTGPISEEVHFLPVLVRATGLEPAPPD